MDYDSNLIRFFLLAPILPCLVMVTTIIRRRLFGEIPWFSIYLGSLVVGSSGLFATYQAGGHHPSLADKYLYFYTAWFFEGVSATLEFMVIRDCIRSLLGEIAAVRRVAIFIFSSVVIGLMVAAVWLGPQGSDGSDALIRWLLVSVRAIRALQVGLIVALFALSSYVGLRWKNYAFGVAIGFGLYAASSLAGIAFVAQKGATFAWKTTLIDQFSFMATLAIWMTYILRREKLPHSATEPTLVGQLDLWNDSLALVHARSVVTE